MSADQSRRGSRSVLVAWGNDSVSIASARKPAAGCEDKSLPAGVASLRRSLYGITGCLTAMQLWGSTHGQSDKTTTCLSAQREACSG